MTAVLLGAWVALIFVSYRLSVLMLTKAGKI
jgi:hypothetical protein